MNDVGAEVEAIESTLGTNPHHSTSRSVNYGSVDARLEAIETDYTQGGHSHDHSALSGLGDDDHPQYLLKALGTTKGDIIGYTASGTPIRIGVGSDGQVLTAASGQAPGVQWATPDSGVTDHGGLTGLGDDDHTQYAKKAGETGYTGIHDFASGRIHLAELSENQHVVTSGASRSLNLGTSTVFYHEIDQNVTFSITASSTDIQSFTLFLYQSGAGPFTITWPASVVWAGGTPPTLLGSNGTLDVLTFVDSGPGENWCGFVAGQAMA